MARYDFSTHGLGWRFHLIPFLSVRNTVHHLNWGDNNIVFDGDVYQFGVWSGFSLQAISHVLRTANQNVGIETKPRYFGFDVFTGMPQEEAEPSKQIDMPGWYNLLEHYKVNTLDEAMSLLREDILFNMTPGTELNFVQGLVQDTLTDDLVAKYGLKPAYYVDLDMDIYSPTQIALDWMFKHKLIVEGTVIGYDDWGQNWPQDPTYTCGESRAHKEVFEKYHADAIQLIETQEHGQAAFLVTKIHE